MVCCAQKHGVLLSMETEQWVLPPFPKSLCPGSRPSPSAPSFDAPSKGWLKNPWKSSSFPLLYGILEMARSDAIDILTETPLWLKATFKPCLVFNLFFCRIILIFLKLIMKMESWGAVKRVQRWRLRAKHDVIRVLRI